tara:strand:- start:25786 stop:27414 length:1629 start_codon:yes stop_codon:yes gene_type:complete
LEESRQNQILIYAPDLLGETLSVQLSSVNKNIKVLLSKEDLTSQPKLVIWSIDNNELPNTISLELARLQERWDPSPILLLLPENINLNPDQILQYDCPGLLQSPNLKTLNEAINILMAGGRFVRINDQKTVKKKQFESSFGLGQWLLISGTQEINNALEDIAKALKYSSENPLLTLIILGRKRELNQAKSLLNYLWGPPQLSIQPLNGTYSKSNISNDNYTMEIKLKEKNPIAVCEEIFSRINNSVQGQLINSTGNLLALEGLKSSYRKELLTSLSNQLNQVILKLRDDKESNNKLQETWTELQPQLKQQTLRSLIGNYTRLELNGEPKAVGDELISRSDLNYNDYELPCSLRFLEPLILNKPLLLEGKLISPDDPRSIIHLELLLSNWIIRTAELISSEIISISSDWPEFRHYILNNNLVSTRELEKLRNQLNSQNQLQNLFTRPIRLYESKRLFYIIKNGNIKTTLVTEPRDDELRKLDWWQQQVTLLVEARDAIAPQLQSLIKYLGDLMVIILTKVIGRAIGLVGKGIAQGMGRSLSKG